MGLTLKQYISPYHIFSTLWNLVVPVSLGRIDQNLASALRHFSSLPFLHSHDAWFFYFEFLHGVYPNQLRLLGVSSRIWHPLILLKFFSGCQWLILVFLGDCFINLFVHNFGNRGVLIGEWDYRNSLESDDFHSLPRPTRLCRSWDKLCFQAEKKTKRVLASANFVWSVLLFAHCYSVIKTANEVLW